MNVVLITALCLGATGWHRLAVLPDQWGVAGAFAGVSDGALIVAGGANFPNGFPWEGGKKVWHDDIFVLTASDGSWQRVGKLPRPLAYGVSINTDRGLICIGGNDATQQYADVFLLNHRGETTRLPDLPLSLANAAGAQLDGIIYVAGGETAEGTRKIFLAFDGKQWRQLPPWPGCGRMLAQAAAVKDAFYLVGGVELIAGKRRYLRDAYRYHPTTGWERLPDLPRPLAAAPAIGGERLLIFGGDDGSKVGAQPHPGFCTEILSYENGWKTVGQLPAPRVTTTAVRWNGQIVIPSGEARPGVRSPEVWATP